MSGRTNHSRERIRHALAVAGLLIAAVPGLGRADDEASAAGAPARTVVVGPEYHAGPFHRWLWGADYRPLWTASLQVEILDLQHFAGGLKPVMRVGGQETKGLAMKGADGRDYTFRGIDKDPTSILPEDLRDTWARSLVQDQIAANHPASFFVVDELMSSSTTRSTSGSRRTPGTARTPGPC